MYKMICMNEFIWNFAFKNKNASLIVNQQNKDSPKWHQIIKNVSQYMRRNSLNIFLFLDIAS